LWIGNNDVLGYATSGGDGTNPITDQALFDQAMGGIVATLTSGSSNGIIANIPSVTDAPFFTTVPHNPLDPTNPSFGPLIPTLNGIFGQLNQVYAFLGAPERSVVFATDAASAVVIKDETLVDISAQIAGVLNASLANLLGTIYGQTRQATADDLLVLTSSSVIGTPNANVAALINGFYCLQNKWK